MPWEPVCSFHSQHTPPSLVITLKCGLPKFSLRKRGSLTNPCWHTGSLGVTDLPPTTKQQHSRNNPSPCCRTLEGPEMLQASICKDDDTLLSVLLPSFCRVFGPFQRARLSLTAVPSQETQISQRSDSINHLWARGALPCPGAVWLQTGSLPGMAATLEPSLSSPPVLFRPTTILDEREKDFCIYPLQSLQACSFLEEGRPAGWGQNHCLETPRKSSGRTRCIARAR